MYVCTFFTGIRLKRCVDVYVQVNVFTCGYVKLQSVCVSIYEIQYRDQTAPAVIEESSLPFGSV